jgi:hypothetical protein
MRGAWAHALPSPEAGCLLARRPFAAELLRSPGPTRTAVLKAAKKDMLESMTGKTTGFLVVAALATSQHAPTTLFCVL